MALTLATDAFGVTFPNAYHRVVNVIAGKNTGIRVDIEVLPTVDSIDTLKFDTKVFEWQDAIAGSNPLSQAYELVKTLPEYKGAKDC